MRRVPSVGAAYFLLSNILRERFATRTHVSSDRELGRSPTTRAASAHSIGMVVPESAVMDENYDMCKFSIHVLPQYVVHRAVADRRWLSSKQLA
jgi:hypothetical protein